MPKKAQRYKPTDGDRLKVKSMASVGIPNEIIALRIKVTEEDLLKFFESELRTVLAEVRAMGSANLFASAKAGNPAAVFFWLKTRAGWSEAAYLSRSNLDERTLPQIPQTCITMPCNSRDWCVRQELWIPYLEQWLQELLEKQSKL